MSLRYAAILAPACAFTHSQQPRRIIVRRDYSSIDDVFDSMFDDAFDAWSPFGLSRRRDPWSQFGLSRRRSPLAQQFGQLKRLSQAFEEQLQRVERTTSSRTRPWAAPPLETRKSAATKDGDAPGPKATRPSRRRPAWLLLVVELVRDAERRDAHYGPQEFQGRWWCQVVPGARLARAAGSSPRHAPRAGDAKAKLDEGGFGGGSAGRAPGPAAGAQAGRGGAQAKKEELAADAEIAKLKAELKALRGESPLPPADYGTTQV